MFPSEAARDCRFETNVGSGIPAVEHGVVYKRGAKPEGKVAELWYFLFSAGVVEGDDFAVTGRQKNNNHSGCEEEQSVTHKGC